MRIASSAFAFKASNVEVLRTTSRRIGRAHEWLRRCGGVKPVRTFHYENHHLPKQSNHSKLFSSPYSHPNESTYFKPYPKANKSTSVKPKLLQSLGARCEVGFEAGEAGSVDELCHEPFGPLCGALELQGPDCPRSDGVVSWGVGVFFFFFFLKIFFGGRMYRLPQPGESHAGGVGFVGAIGR